MSRSDTSVAYARSDDDVEVKGLQKWEYASVPLISHALQEILNQWGEDGWELVQVLESTNTGVTAFMRRPKNAS
jgi:hypothetical protein